MNLEAIFAPVEAAIDAHAELDRIGDIRGEPRLVISRHGVQLRIRVKLLGSRRKPEEIYAVATTPEEAGRKLVEDLDFWAQAIRR